MANLIVFDCPKCTKKIKARPFMGGREVNCPNCKERVDVPIGDPSLATLHRLDNIVAEVEIIRARAGWLLAFAAIAFVFSLLSGWAYVASSK